MGDVERNAATIQYVGWIEERSGYHNFWPVGCIEDDELIELSDDDMYEQFPQFGNINLFHSPYINISDRYAHGDMVALTIFPGDLRDNVRARDGDMQPTEKKLDILSLEANAQIKPLFESDIYPVVHPVDDDALTQDLIYVSESFLQPNQKYVVELGHDLYGPFVSTYAGDEVALTNKFNSVVSRRLIPVFTLRRGAARQLDMSNHRQFPSNGESVRLAYLSEKSYEKRLLDLISDEELIRLFSRSMEGRKTEDEAPVTAEILNSIFHNVPDDIASQRRKRIEVILHENLEQKEAEEDIARLIADAIQKYGNHEYFNTLIERILEDKALAKKIQSFSIVRRKVEEAEEELQLVRNEAAALRDIQADVNQVSARSAIGPGTPMRDAIRDETVNMESRRQELEQLEAAITQRRSELALLDEVKDLRLETKNLRRRNDELAAEEADISRRIDAAADALEKKLRDVTSQTLDTAFNGRIADRVLKAAADWDRESEKDAIEKLARSLTRAPENAGDLIVPEAELADYVVEMVSRYRPRYSRNEILNIGVCIAQNFLTVFAGPPGIGKTSICDIFAHILGTSRVGELADSGSQARRFVTVPVERGWTSKRDFVGYYNPLSQSFESADARLYEGLRALDAEGENSRYPFIVLLDEANLSPMEYYWADFMNLGDSDTYFSSLTLGNKIELHIPPTLRFLATINSDDTTERLSPRLIDRAMMVKLPDVKYEHVEDERLKNLENVRIVAWDAFQNVFGVQTVAEPDSTAGEIYDDILAFFHRELHIRVSPRVERAILRFWTTAKELFEREDEVDRTIVALDYAVAQKLLPKIGGSGDNYKAALEELAKRLARNNLTKSAAITEEIVERGDINMGYYEYC